MSVGSLSSIAPYLPLQDIDGKLRWIRSTEYALKAVVRGPNTSMVDSAMALYDFIEDLRSENGDLKPVSQHVAVGLSRLCDAVSPACPALPSLSRFLRSLLLYANL